jgi:hypothetical protein
LLPRKAMSTEICLVHLIDDADFDIRLCNDFSKLLDRLSAAKTTTKFVGIDHEP